jgi:hypothetical protein
MALGGELKEGQQFDSGILEEWKFGELLKNILRRGRMRGEMMPGARQTCLVGRWDHIAQAPNCYRSIDVFCGCRCRRRSESGRPDVCCVRGRAGTVGEVWGWFG